jgi:cyclic pyranopterin phosphate synthase
MALTDKFGRQITDLRVSVTDRCNFRCVYCRSADPENHMAEHALLEWDEYERLVRILVGMGIRKVRVTGGEPLVRPGVEDFVARLKAIGVQDLSMTTNGHLLAERCDRLVAAGLNQDVRSSACRNRGGAGFAAASCEGECGAGARVE